MVKYVALFLALFGLAAPVAFAQYGPPSTLFTGSSVGFQPLGKTSQLNTTTTSISVPLGSVSFPVTQVQVYNTGTTAVFVIFCTSNACTASAGTNGTASADYPVGPGAVIVVTVPAGTTFAGAVNGSGSGSVYFTPGIGL